MALIVDYATLKTEAAAMYANGRSDLVTLWSGFVQRAEAELNRVLRVNPQSALVTLTAASGVLTVPTGWARVRSLRQTEANKPRIDVTDIVTVEEYLSEVTETGDPEYACEIDGTIYLAPAPVDGVTFRVICQKVVPALSDSATTNWLLLNHPDVYLYGTLEQASVYDHDDGARANYAAKFREGIATLVKIERDDKFGDRLAMQPNGGVA